MTGKKAILCLHAELLLPELFLSASLGAGYRTIGEEVMQHGNPTTFYDDYLA